MSIMLERLSIFFGLAVLVVSGCTTVSRGSAQYHCPKERELNIAWSAEGLAPQLPTTPQLSSDPAVKRAFYEACERLNAGNFTKRTQADTGIGFIEDPETHLRLWISRDNQFSIQGQAVDLPTRIRENAISALEDAFPESD